MKGQRDPELTMGWHSALSRHSSRIRSFDVDNSRRKCLYTSLERRKSSWTDVHLFLTFIFCLMRCRCDSPRWPVSLTDSSSFLEMTGRTEKAAKASTFLEA
jgi:hypothetical protein